MEMFNRESGVNEPIGTRTLEDLKQHQLRIFNLMIHIYSITQKDNENNWLFEWKEHNGLQNEKSWRTIFIKSLGTNFDFNKRWLDMPQLIETGVASTSAKKELSQLNVNYLMHEITKVGRKK